MLKLVLFKFLLYYMPSSDRFGNICKTSTKNLARKRENSIRLQHPFVPIAQHTILSAIGSTGSYITAESVGIILFNGAEKDIFGAEKDKFRAETDEFILKKKQVFTLGAENEQ